MSNSSETCQLSEERRNEIATKALVYMKIYNGFRIDFFLEKSEPQKSYLKLAKKIDRPEDEVKKFIKEMVFTIFQHYCKTTNMPSPQLDYTPDEDEVWIKRRNEIGFALLIYESTRSHLQLHFRPDSEEKKAQLCRAYDCSDEELTLFKEEIMQILLKKAFDLF